MLEARLDRRNLLIVTLTAFILRLGLAIWFYVVKRLGPDVVGGGDAGAYMGMAHYVYSSATLSSSLFLPRPPLFPALAGVFYHVIGEAPFVIIFINLIINVISCLVIYQLARTIGQSPRRALAAGLLAAIYPAMLLSADSYMTESLFVLFLSLSLLLLARYLNQYRARDLLLSMATMACATLTRVITLVLPVVLVWLLIRRGPHWKRYAATFLLAALLPGAILTFRNWYYADIPTFSTNGQWTLLFMRATASARRATNEPVVTIYAHYIQEIEQRMGNPVPPLSSITTDSIWGYFQPTPAMQSAISQLAIEENLKYPQWYILNTFYGLHRIFSITDDGLLPAIIEIPLHYAFVLAACLGFFVVWRRDRRIALMLGLTALFIIGATVALETSVLDTRHGIGAAVPMFVLAPEGFVLAREFVAKRRAGRSLQNVEGAA